MLFIVTLIVSMWMTTVLTRRDEMGRLANRHKKKCLHILNHRFDSIRSRQNERCAVKQEICPNTINRRNFRTSSLNRSEWIPRAVLDALNWTEKKVQWCEIIDHIRFHHRYIKTIFDNFPDAFSGYWPHKKSAYT